MGFGKFYAFYTPKDKFLMFESDPLYTACSDKRLMFLCKEKQEVRDDGTEEGRKDEGIPDAPHLMRSEESERV